MRTPKHKWIKQLVQDPRDRLIVEICMHMCICVCLNGFGPSRAFSAHRGQAALLGSSHHRVPGISNETPTQRKGRDFLWFAQMEIKLAFKQARNRKAIVKKLCSAPVTAPNQLATEQRHTGAQQTWESTCQQTL